tara:strand:- start:317 stop:2602 length:2286 start_codon:yes stop_codon:yes gene_type:complete
MPANDFTGSIRNFVISSLPVIRNSVSGSYDAVSGGAVIDYVDPIKKDIQDGISSVRKMMLQSALKLRHFWAFGVENDIDTFATVIFVEDNQIKIREYVPLNDNTVIPGTTHDKINWYLNEDNAFITEFDTYGQIISATNNNKLIELSFAEGVRYKKNGTINNYLRRNKVVLDFSGENFKQLNYEKQWITRWPKTIWINEMRSEYLNTFGPASVINMEKEINIGSGETKPKYLLTGVPTIRSKNLWLVEDNYILEVSKSTNRNPYLPKLYNSEYYIEYPDNLPDFRYEIFHAKYIINEQTNKISHVLNRRGFVSDDKLSNYDVELLDDDSTLLSGALNRTYPSVDMNLVEEDDFIEFISGIIDNLNLFIDPADKISKAQELFNVIQFTSDPLPTILGTTASHWIEIVNKKHNNYEKVSLFFLTGNSNFISFDSTDMWTVAPGKNDFLTPLPVPLIKDYNDNIVSYNKEDTLNSILYLQNLIKIFNNIENFNKISYTDDTYPFSMTTTNDHTHLLIFISSGETFGHPIGGGADLTDGPDFALLKNNGPLKAFLNNNTIDKLKIATVQPNIIDGSNFVSRMSNTIKKILNFAKPDTKIIFGGYSLGSIFAVQYLNEAFNNTALYSTFDSVWLQSPSLIPSSIVGMFGMGASFTTGDISDGGDYKTVFENYTDIIFSIYTHSDDSFLGNVNFGWAEGSMVSNLNTLESLATTNSNVTLYTITETSTDPHSTGMRHFENNTLPLNYLINGTSPTEDQNYVIPLSDL